MTNPNYKPSETDLDSYVKITQKPVTVTADPNSKVFGEEDPEFTATTVGTLNGDTVEYTLTREEGEAAGTYDIIADGEKSQGNYSVSYYPGIFTISAADRDEAVTVTSYRGEYDAEAHTITVNGLKEGDQVEYSYDGGKTWVDERKEYTNVTDGVEVIYVKVTNENYEAVDPLAGSVYIWPKEVTVTADNNGKTYGEADPELTAKAEGLLGEDTVAYDVRRAEGEDAGEYPIYVIGEADQGNYHVTYVKGIFTISKADREKEISVTPYEGVYDAEAHTIQVNNLVDGDVVEYSYDNGTTWTPVLNSYVDVTHGSINIAVRVTNNNYEPSVITEYTTVIITPFEIVVKADDQSKVYGEKDPEFTASVQPKNEGEIKPDDGIAIRYDSEFVRQPGEDV